MLQVGQVVETPDGRLWKVLSVDNMGAMIRTLRGYGRPVEVGESSWEQPRTLLVSSRSVLPIIEKEGRFRLKPIGDTLRMWRWSHDGRCKDPSGMRRIDAVCWHGHRDFFRALFKIHPNCIIQTRQIRYYGSDDFELRYDESDINVGSQFRPLNHSEACKCKS